MYNIENNVNDNSDIEEGNDCYEIVNRKYAKYEGKIVISLMIFVVVYAIISFTPYLLMYNDLFFCDGSHKLKNIGETNIVLERGFVTEMIYNESVSFKRVSLLDEMIFDKYYHPLNQIKVINYLKEDQTNKLIYKKDVRDCDDYSILIYSYFKKAQGYYYNSSLAIGIIIGKTKIDDENGHVINVFINEKMKLICFEPQSDKMDDCNKMMEVLYEVIM